MIIKSVSEFRYLPYGLQIVFFVILLLFLASIVAWVNSLILVAITPTSTNNLIYFILTCLMLPLEIVILIGFIKRNKLGYQATYLLYFLFLVRVFFPLQTFQNTTPALGIASFMFWSFLAMAIVTYRNRHFFK